MTALNDGKTILGAYWYQCDGPECDVTTKLLDNEYMEWYHTGADDAEEDFCTAECASKYTELQEKRGEI